MVMIAGGDKIHKGCTVQRGIKLTDELLLHFTYYYYILLLTLKTRREKLCKSFAQKCTRNVKVKSVFQKVPVKDKSEIKTNIYFVNFATTERYLKSSIPYMQRMLNSEHKVKSKLIRCRGS